MVFVNSIAEIVNSIVDYFKGNPNKNIGDAFLLVMEISRRIYKKSEEWKYEAERMLRS